MALVKEKNELSAADQAMIMELQFKVKNLESENYKLTNEKKTLAETLKVRVEGSSRFANQNWKKLELLRIPRLKRRP